MMDDPFDPTMLDEFKKVVALARSNVTTISAMLDGCDTLTIVDRDDLEYLCETNAYLRHARKHLYSLKAFLRG